MWRLRLKRLMAERDILIALFISGVLAWGSDLLNIIGQPILAAIIKVIGLFSFVGLLIFEFFLRKPKLSAIPIMFTEETDRGIARNMFNDFVQAAKLNPAVKILTAMFKFQLDDLTIRLNCPNPRDSHDPHDWTNAWAELLQKWEQEVDRKLTGELPSIDGRCYHIFPHIILPLAFGLGASVNLRRSLILYHKQEERYLHVLDLSNPREIFNKPDDTVPPPQIIPESPDALPKADKLILHIFISTRHPLNLEAHPDHSNSANAALIYDFDLDPEARWLPYVQWIFQKAKPLIAQYKQVEICLSCPSAIAFALGMAFSRTPHLTVCHWFADNQYRPVFQLAQIERRPPFS